jgi:alpha-L-fucosidase
VILQRRLAGLDCIIPLWKAERLDPEQLVALTVGEVIRMLTDIVSKSGNLLLNVVQTFARRSTISRKIRYIGQRYRVQPA